ncbi:MAG: biotin/lipoyl-binding protein [Parvularculaceae bacterium]
MRAALIIAVLALAGCSEKAATHLNGYVEADMLYLSSQDAGVVAELAVREGDRVRPGDPLFSLDDKRLSYTATQASASAAAVQKRVENAGALDQAVAEAEAELDRVTKNLERTLPLLKDGFVSQARFDNDKALVDEAAARLERARAERDAAQEDLKSMEAQAALAHKRLGDLAVIAPAAGTVERIYRRAGEVVAPGEPVIALLPPEI